MKKSKFQSDLYDKILKGHFLFTVAINNNKKDKCKKEIDEIISNLPNKCLTYTIKEKYITNLSENIVTHIHYP